MKYEDYYQSHLRIVHQTLDQWLPRNGKHPPAIHDVMRYAIFPGGKRFRAVLTLAACEACGGKAEDAACPAAAIELIHGYSLVHDDLPALDNDDLRRGKPTVHKQYGEALAILAGDGLLTLAFQILAAVQPAEKAVRLLEEISTASGTYGMIGGQVADLITDPEKLSLPMLDYINAHKTGKLIKASAVSGAIAAQASKKNCDRMNKYGELIGLAFQSVDDLMDGDGYLKLAKSKDVRSKTRDLIAEAKRTVKPLGTKAAKLMKLADYLLSRIPRGTHAQVD